MLKPLELGLRGGEEGFDLLDVIVHRAADVQEQQNLDRVAALGPHLDRQHAGVLAGFFERVRQIQFVDRAFAREATQPTQRNLDVSRVEIHVVVVVAKLSLVPHLHCAAHAALVLPDANARRVVAIRAERRGAAGADPFVATLVALLLLFKTLLERLHELVPVHRLELLALFGRKHFFDDFLEPIFRDRGLQIDEVADAFEILRKCKIKAIKLALVLDQRRLRQKIKIVDRRRNHVRLQRLQ